MKTNFKFFSLIGIMVLSLNFIGCEKDDDGDVDDTTDPTSNRVGTFTDSRNNYTYNWIEIGEQIWMAENLAYNPNNGDFVAHENNEANIAIYGYLYGWNTAQNIAPSGWHLPSEAEWLELVNSLGGEEVAGGKMKEIGTAHWNTPNTGANNSSGFTALAGGLYDSVYDRFVTLGRSACWWSSTDEYGDNNEAAFYLVIYAGNAYTSRGAVDKSQYLSVRCIKD